MPAKNSTLPFFVGARRVTDVAVSLIALSLFAALLPITNPPGNAPIFLALTHGMSDGARRAMARRVGLNSMLLLLAAAFVGSHVLAFFDISLPVVRGRRRVGGRGGRAAAALLEGLAVAGGETVVVAAAIPFAVVVGIAVLGGRGKGREQGGGEKRSEAHGVPFGQGARRCQAFGRVNASMP